MNEPKKSEIEAAIKKRWPNSLGSKINQRKHTAFVFFAGGRTRKEKDFTLEASSHRKLLELVTA